MSECGFFGSPPKIIAAFLVAVSHGTAITRRIRDGELEPDPSNLDLALDLMKQSVAN